MAVPHEPCSTPKADAQRAIYQALRVALPSDAMIHHCANEVTEPGSRGQFRQSTLVGMGVHTGIADPIVISGGRVLFLKVQSPTRPVAQITGGLPPYRLRPRLRLGAGPLGRRCVGRHGRKLAVMAENGFTSRIRPARRVAP